MGGTAGSMIPEIKAHRQIKLMEANLQKTATMTMPKPKPRQQHGTNRQYVQDMSKSTMTTFVEQVLT
ncbi:hypothetical protein NC652_001278 [Populus alba x Populus x berolinensis]|nr:hypothetical protein NC652_001278 [Populus alba x Populus x berolinensis]